MLYLYNTLARAKQPFRPLHEGHVGMYVCGPTVYGDAHLGHARPAITFDILFRYLTNIGYKVRYVRNITDVGHLEHDADEVEDKIAKKARLEQLEPMEVVQFFTNRYHHDMEALNVLPTGRTRNVTPTILHCGRRLLPSISCTGRQFSATPTTAKFANCIVRDFPAGTWSVLPWERNIWARSSTSTAEEWI